MTFEKVAAMATLARRHLTHFTEVTFPKYDRTPMHDIYSEILNEFAHNRIKRLIITMPPQHGKTELSSRRLPAFVEGIRPGTKIVIASYSQGYARKIARDVKRIFMDPKYWSIFPNVKLATMADKGYVNSIAAFDIVGTPGSITMAGRGTGLTGLPVDILLMDDMYKNAEEANSPVIRESVIDWYMTVAETRLHNDSQELIVFTRWHQEDLVGWLESQGLVEEFTSFRQLKGLRPEKWLKVNFPAIKDTPPTEVDPRKKGQALWPAKHSLDRLKAKRKQNQEVFDSLYQGDPKPSKGMLYETGFEEYFQLPELVGRSIAFCDTADEGKDYLCFICGLVGSDNLIYITDVLYTQESQEVTEHLSASMLVKNKTSIAWVESNSGGRAFARNVEAKVRAMKGNTSIEWFHQTLNKESRIITYSSNVRSTIRFPRGWKLKWPEFANDLLTFRKLFRANKHDDAPDALTGLYEKWVNKGAGASTKKLGAR